MSQADSDEIKGDLFRVTHVDEESGTAFVRYADGRTARLTNIEEGALEKNDVILSHSNGWTIVPEEVWPRSFLTSVVRTILDDGTILGESGNALLVLGRRLINTEPEPH